MQLPFSVEQFFAVFEAYNRAFWPLHLLAYGLGLVAVLLAARQGQKAQRMVSGILALLWLWMGVAYHMLYFSTINPGAWVFGFFFCAQAVVFAVAGVFQSSLRLSWALTPRHLLGALLIFYAMLAYPLLGLAVGHTLAAMPHFGLAPCPTAIFTFGLLLWARPPVPFYVLVIPLFWAAVGTVAAVKLQVPQDYALLPGALLALGIILYANRRQRSTAHA